MKNSRHILVTGGAGYIGSHACKALQGFGYIPVTLDNFSTGWEEFVKFGPLEKCDLLEKENIDRIIQTYKPIAVLHFASLSQVRESILKPELYWRNNVLGSLNLIQSCIEHKCMKFVYSSTCATFGNPSRNEILNEQSTQNPINAYGASKRAVEDILMNFKSTHGLESIIFRYFNVAGADPDAEIGERHIPETHLIPLIFNTIKGKHKALHVYGSDYDTPDGTCIRDYIHVCDLIDAHLLGLRWLVDGKGSNVFNLGTGHGYSVMEVLRKVSEVTNHSFPVINDKRRAGDASTLVSSSKLASIQLGWKADRSNLNQIISDAWHWHQKDTNVIK